MPTSTLSFQRVARLLPPELPAGAIEEALFASKAEVERRDGDELELSATPDRLDLLTEGGVALHLQGALGLAVGLPPIRRRRSRNDRWSIAVDGSVDPLRPAIAGVRVRAPSGSALDEATLAEAIRFQELLHATVGRDRRTMSLGIYPAGRVEPPVRYALEPIDSVRFVPLDGTEEVGGPDFFAAHPMALRYGALGRSEGRCLTLRDADGSVLSLPPILNSRGTGEARVGDRELLLESTGTRPRAVREALGLLLVVFAAQGWSVLPLPVDGPGPNRQDGTALTMPHAIDLPVSLLRAVTGQPYPAPEVARLLGRARLGGRRARGGWAVRAAPWRPDLLTPIEVVEDLVHAAGVRPEDGVLPASSTRGRRRPEARFRRRVATWLLGLGFAEPHTPLLVPASLVAEVGGEAALKVVNPVSAEFAFVRDRLLYSLAGVLSRNTRHGYPQRFAEVGPVVVRAPHAESGGETRYRAGLVVASEKAGFADAAALVDCLLRDLDVGSVREPAELPGTIPGRAARGRSAGEIVAELGELHPRLLAQLGVPVPVAWAELDLTALWLLTAGRDTA